MASDASLDDVLKHIFIRGLPRPLVTAITASLGEKFATVITAANKAWTASVANSNNPAASVAAVSALQYPSACCGSRGGRGGRQRGARAGPQMTTLTLCSYHNKFGDGARKCAQGCARWDEYRSRNIPATQVFSVEEALDGEDSHVGESENF